MKNSKYFPFERNNYFYGKLLSVDDFQLEQRYVNNKRRLTNRFIYGSGIVAGLYVVRVDDKTISVESGIGLDSMGREIVVDTSVIKKLSLIDGYQNYVEEGNKDYVYLCIDYNEEETEQVHNIAGNASARNRDETYNKIKETYRLYLTDVEPEEAVLDKSSLYENCAVLYQQDGIIIKQFVPKYAPAGGSCDIRIEIENTTKSYLAFSYEIIMECFAHNGQSVLSVNFNEMQFEKTGKYTVSYKIDAVDTQGIHGNLVRNGKDFKLFIDKNEISPLEKQETDYIQIIDKDIRQQVIDDYYRLAMDNIADQNKQEKLYLAKMYILHIGGSYVIDRVENVPFNQYVLNQNLSFALHQLSIDDESGGAAGNFSDHKASKSNSKSGSENGIRMAQGTYWLDLEGGGQKGTRYESEEITHGLGIGQVIVQAGIEGDDQSITYGSSEIFEKMDVFLELAVRVYPERGTFKIGGRLLEQVIKGGVNIKWVAFMNTEEKVVEKTVRKIFIKPSVLELNTRESHYLEVVCSNMADNAIEWQIKDNGGSITENGMYTAPNTPGVYEITAQSIAYPDVRASIFVVVRES